MFAAYFALKLSNPLWLVAMFAISIPLLIISGWFQVHKYSVVTDWLNVNFATYWSRFGYSLSIWHGFTT